MSKTLNGIAKICKTCSHKWTLSPAAPRSWHCNRCGGSHGEPEVAFLCRCGHEFEVHRTSRAVPPSLGALTLRIEDGDGVQDILGALSLKPAEAPEIGTCMACACDTYRLMPPPLSATDCLKLVEKYLYTQGHGRDNIVNRKSDVEVTVERKGCHAIARIMAPNEIELSMSGQSARVFATDEVSPGQIVIALIEMLESRSHA